MCHAFMQLNTMGVIFKPNHLFAIKVGKLFSTTAVLEFLTIIFGCPASFLLRTHTRIFILKYEHKVTPEKNVLVSIENYRHFNQNYIENYRILEEKVQIQIRVQLPDSRCSERMMIAEMDRECIFN